MAVAHWEFCLSYEASVCLMNMARILEIGTDKSPGLPFVSPPLINTTSWANRETHSLAAVSELVPGSLSLKLLGLRLNWNHSQIFGLSWLGKNRWRLKLKMNSGCLLLLDWFYIFLSRTFLCSFNDQDFNRALERSALPWTKNWDEPKYLPDFLMQIKMEDRKWGGVAWIGSRF